MNKRWITKLSFVGIIIIMLLWASIDIYSRKTGITGLTATNSGGCSCHDPSPSSFTSLSVTSSTGSFQFVPESNVTFTVTVMNSGELFAGVNIAIKTTLTGNVNIGTLSVESGSGLQILNNEITHTAPKAMSSGKVEFTFSWKAPATTGIYYLRAIGNAVNGDGKPSPADQHNWLTPQELIVSAVSPAIATTSISKITSNSSLSGGNVTNDGGALVTDRGVCWSILHNPTINDNKTSDGTGIGIFSSQLSGLAKSTTYYIRAYATNEAGTGYGDEESFNTADFDIFLNQGWNMISSNIIPQAPDSLQNIYADVNNNLVITKNNNGDVYIPSFDINDIGKWDITQGYQVYMINNDTLGIFGMAVIPENAPIPLSSGWNMPAYLRNSPMDAVMAFESITDNDNLIIAKDNDGNVYIPMFDINDIGNLNPGQGYQIYVSNNDNLIYPQNFLSKSISNYRTNKPKYLLPKYKNTGSNSTLILKVETIDGSEIGIYNDKDEIVGSGIVNNGIAVITIWGDNLRTKEIDGALSSYELKVMSYELKTGKMSEVNLTELTDFISKNEVSDLKYSKDKIFFAKAEIKSNSGISLIINPNPAYDNVEIEFFSTDSKNTEISIYSIEGKLVDKIQNLSYNSIIYNISKFSSGEYTIIMTCGNEKAMRKVLVVK